MATTTPPPNPPTPPDGDWPVGETTLVERAPPGPPLPPPAGLPPDDAPGNRIGLGMLVGILAVAVIGGVVAAIYLARDDNKQAQSTTVVVTRTAPATTARTPAPVRVTVPDLIGQSKQQAATVLGRAGFKITYATVAGPPPADRVVSQSPDPGATKPHGAMITLSVSDGSVKPTTSTSTATTSTTAASPAPTSAAVPDLSSGDVRAAVTALNAKGFLVTLAYVPSNDPLGTVEAQSPAAGGTAQTGAHVTVNASSGPGTKPQQAVPDVSGKTVTDALAAVNAAGLRLIVLKRPVTDRTQVGKVVEQTPAAGKSVPQNAQVLVYWGALER